jgi:hypothetical protein
MSIDQADVVDFVTIEKASGNLRLSISDHLAWEENEESHLALLQSKLNAYMRFIQSGEIFDKVPEAKNRSIVISLVGKFPLSENADRFFQIVRAAMESAGVRLQFQLMPQN